MMRALIDGYRICEVRAEGFPVAAPLKWVDVPDDTTTADTWDGSAVVKFAAPAPTAEDVKAEAERRILAICPEWRQRNLTARAAELAAKGQANWTADEQAEWDAGADLWARIKSIREASDDIEALDPIPQDYAADSRWP